MRFVKANGLVIHYLAEGPEALPPLVFINPLGCDLRVWSDVASILKPDFRVVAYDKRGHGLSESGPDRTEMADYAADLAALLDVLGIGRAAIVGMSIGGVIAQELTRQRPELVAALVLCATAAKIGTDESWDERIAAVERGGIESIAGSVLERWFTAGVPRRPRGGIRRRPRHADPDPQAGLSRRLRRLEARRPSALRRRDRSADPLPRRRPGRLHPRGPGATNCGVDQRLAV